MEEKIYPSLTTYFLLDKNDWNHFRTVPERPTQDFILLINIEWLIVSKAADKSKRTRTTESSISEAKKMSFNTLRRADSVLWAALKPD